MGVPLQSDEPRAAGQARNLCLHLPPYRTPRFLNRMPHFQRTLISAFPDADTSVCTSCQEHKKYHGYLGYI